MEDLLGRLGHLASIGSHFGIAEAPFIEISPIGSSSFSVTHILRRPEIQGSFHAVLPDCESYIVVQYLAGALHCDVNGDGSPREEQVHSAGKICVLDLERGASIFLHTALDAFVIVISKTLLREVARLPNAPGASKLKSLHGVRDVTMASLAPWFLTLFKDVNPANRQIFKHLAVAICAHLLQTYGVGARPPPMECARLTDEQLRRSEAFILAHLRDPIANAQIAASLGIGEIEFVEGLLKAMGLGPEELINRMRIEKAKSLLKAGIYSTRAIAEECGFVEEESFVDAFHRCTGMSPDQWRKSLHH